VVAVGVVTNNFKNERCCLHVVSNPSANLVDLYCLESPPMLLRANVQHLISGQEFELACQLAQNIQDDKFVGEKQKRVTEIKNMFAFHLFCRKQFREAMRLFEEINAGDCLDLFLLLFLKNQSVTVRLLSVCFRVFCKFFILSTHSSDVELPFLLKNF